MANRNNHYEAALEAYLRRYGIPYVAVDEQRRSLHSGQESLKSLDFLVSPVGGRHKYLVDVKGRRFESRSGGKRWANWTTADDLTSLARWEELFGPDSQALLVFVYNVVGDASPVPVEKLLVFRQRLYAFLGIRLDHYLSAAREISPRWQTLAMPVREFRALALPLDQWWPTAESAAPCPDHSLTPTDAARYASHASSPAAARPHVL